MSYNPPPHSSEEILPRLTYCTLAHLRGNKSPFLKSYLYTVDATSHPSPLYPSVTPTPHIIFSAAPKYMHHVVTLGIVERPRWSDGTAEQMDEKAVWWTSSGKMGLPWVDNNWLPKKKRISFKVSLM